MGTKNNPANRGKLQKKMFDGQVVKPVQYIGTHIGHGKYIAVQFDNGKMAYDQQKKPIMWDSI